MSSSSLHLKYLQACLLNISVSMRLCLCCISFKRNNRFRNGESLIRIYIIWTCSHKVASYTMALRYRLNIHGLLHPRKELLLICNTKFVWVLSKSSSLVEIFLHFLSPFVLRFLYFLLVNFVLRNLPLPPVCDARNGWSSTV